MFNLTKQKFNNFPVSNKNMIYLMWIYNFGNLISTLFISIYVFKLETNVSHVIIYNIIFFVTVFLGFVGIGYLFSILQKNIKNMYYISYIIFITSFMIMFFLKGTIIGSYIFGASYGLGFGIFWCAVHANELNNIKDKDRDFYSSLISAGGNILQIITPILVSIIFLIAAYLNYNGYYILFIVIPIVYFISFLFIKHTGNYIPSVTKIDDVKNFFNIKKYVWGHLYIFLTGVSHALKVIAIPIIAILLLKNEINIGIFESIMGIVSFFIIIFFSHIRNLGNRLKIFGITGILMMLTYIFLAFYFNFLGYIIFSLLLIIIHPIFRVSEHVYDLKIMDSIKIKKSDFFPSMLLREVIINLARVLTLLISLYITNIYGNNLEFFLKLLLIISGFSYLLTWFTIKMHIKYENHENLENLN
ncbi:MAG: hypothetical protein QM490_04755 [Candidatus Gracilibacteria bacterium]